MPWQDDARRVLNFRMTSRDGILRSHCGRAPNLLPTINFPAILAARGDGSHAILAVAFLSRAHQLALMPTTRA